MLSQLNVNVTTDVQSTIIHGKRKLMLYLANIDVGGRVDEGDSGWGAARLDVEEKLPVERVGGEGGDGLGPVVRVGRELHAAQRELAHVRGFRLRTGRQRRQSRHAHHLRYNVHINIAYKLHI